MMDIFKRINKKTIKWFSPWVATLITGLPYSDSRSRFLDRLIDFVEN